MFMVQQLFTGGEEEADLSNNFIVKTCQKFIPVTGNCPFLTYLFVSHMLVLLTLLNGNYYVLYILFLINVTAEYDGDRFFTVHDGVRKVSVVT